MFQRLSEDFSITITLSLLLDNVTGWGLEEREVPFEGAGFVRLGVEARGWMVEGGVDVA